MLIFVQQIGWSSPNTLPAYCNDWSYLKLYVDFLVFVKDFHSHSSAEELELIQSGAPYTIGTLFSFYQTVPTSETVF